MQFLSSAIIQLLPIHEIPCTALIVSANEVKISDGLKLYPKILQFKNKQLALQYIKCEITKIQTTQPAYFLNILFRHSIEMVTMHNHQITSDDLKYQLLFGNCHLDFWHSHFITSDPETTAKCINRH